MSEYRQGDPVSAWTIANPAKCLAAIAFAAILGGCAGTPASDDAAQAPAKPVLADAPQSLWKTPAPAPTSQAFLATGRTGKGLAETRIVPETAYTNDQLLRNFIRIALRAEASDVQGRGNSVGVTKWVSPVRYSVIGAEPGDMVRIQQLFARLQRLTGADIAEAEVEPPNFRISFVPFRLRDEAIHRLTRETRLGPSVSRMVQNWWGGENEKCLGLVSFHPNSSALAKADILIKDELPTQTRNACIVEEIVQSFGLMNDDPDVMPSIFNDDQKYHELTSHDEYLLRILYDPRVRPGMRAGDMLPLANRIIYQLRPPARGNRGRV